MADVGAIAEQEIREIRDHHMRDRFRGDLAVSFLIHQPIPGDHFAKRGRLVDIGPRPSNAYDGHVQQAVDSGKTGSLFGDAWISAQKSARCDCIEDEDIASYSEMNDLTDRQNQIALEALRHGFTFSADDPVPPMGWHIHHLPLYPLNRTEWTFNDGRLPVLGMAYCFTETGTTTEGHPSRRLLDYALPVADAILPVRLAVLLGGAGDELMDLRSRFHHIFTSPRNPEDWATICKMCFVHHWFFPGAPVFYRLLAACGPEPEKVYGDWGWTPPLLGVEHAHSTVSDDLATLSSDITSLAAFVIAGTAQGERKTVLTPQAVADGRRRIASIAATFVMALTGRLASVDARGRITFVDAVPEPFRGEWCVYSAEAALLNAGPYIPVFDGASLVASKGHYGSVRGFMTPGGRPSGSKLPQQHPTAVCGRAGQTLEGTGGNGWLDIMVAREILKRLKVFGVKTRSTT